MDLRKQTRGLALKKFLAFKGGVSLGPIPELVANVFFAAAAKEYGEKLAKQHITILSKISMKLCTVDDVNGIRTEEKLPFARLAHRVIDFLINNLSPQPVTQVDVSPLVAVIEEVRKVVGSWLGNFLPQPILDELCAALDALGPSLFNRLLNSTECAEERAVICRVLPHGSDRVVNHGFLRKRAKYSQTTQARYFFCVLQQIAPKDSVTSDDCTSPRSSTRPRGATWRNRFGGILGRTKDGSTAPLPPEDAKGSQEGLGIERESDSDSNRGSTTSTEDRPSLYSPRSSEMGGNRPMLISFSEKRVKTVDLTGYRIMTDTVASTSGPRYQLTLLPAHGTDVILLEAITKDIRDEWVVALNEAGLQYVQLSVDQVKGHENALIRMAKAVDNVVEKTSQSAKRIGARNQSPIGKNRNAQIHKKLEGDQAAEKMTQTCAVFGSPLSGAVAIMRGVLKLHGDANYRQEEVNLPAIRKVIWDNLRIIAKGCTLPTEVGDFSNMILSPDADLPLAAKILQHVWGLKEVQEMFGARKKELLPNLAYFLDRVDSLFDDGYVLSEGDLNKCSLAQVGTSVEKFSFKLNVGEFQFVHPPTTLSTKLLMNFDRIGFLVWVVSLVDWEQVDPKTGLPYLTQDLSEFQRVCHLEPFAKVPVVCFLNWSRSFLSRMKSKTAVEKFRSLYPDMCKEDPSPKIILENTVQKYRSMINAERRCLPECNLVTAVSGVESAVKKLLDYAVDMNFSQVMERIGF